MLAVHAHDEDRCGLSSACSGCIYVRMYVYAINACVLVHISIFVTARASMYEYAWVCINIYVRMYVSKDITLNYVTSSAFPPP